jgi:hypothetical protein
MGYYDFKRTYEEGLNETYNIQENIVEGRNLAAYFATFTDEEGKKYNFYDIKEIKDCYDNPDNLESRKVL